MSPCDQYHAYINTSQAAKDAQGQDTLVGIFKRIESHFQRLEIYTEVPPTIEMMGAITQIIVEALSIFGIATKEMKQSRLSEYRNLIRVCRC